MLNGKIHGTGVTTYDDGQVETGPHVNGLQHGEYNTNWKGAHKKLAL
jgi:hypothetical protein